MRKELASLLSSVRAIRIEFYFYIWFNPLVSLLNLQCKILDRNAASEPLTLVVGLDIAQSGNVRSYVVVIEVVGRSKYLQAVGFRYR